MNWLILFIDILKFMQEKAGSLSASEWISYFHNIQYRGRGCYYGPLYLRNNPAVEFMILVAANWSLRVLLHETQCNGLC